MDKLFEIYRKKFPNAQKIKGVYTIFHSKSNSIYVGQSNNVNFRFYEHKYELINKTHHNFSLQELWDSFSEIEFDFELVEEAPYTLDALELQRWLAKKEKNLIYELKRLNYIVLNKTQGEIIATAKALELFNLEKIELERTRIEKIEELKILRTAYRKGTVYKIQLCTEILELLSKSPNSSIYEISNLLDSKFRLRNSFLFFKKREYLSQPEILYYEKELIKLKAIQSKLDIDLKAKVNELKSLDVVITDFPNRNEMYEVRRRLRKLEFHQRNWEKDFNDSYNNESLTVDINKNKIVQLEGQIQSLKKILHR